MRFVHVGNLVLDRLDRRLVPTLSELDQMLVVAKTRVNFRLAAKARVNTEILAAQ